MESNFEQSAVALEGRTTELCIMIKFDCMSINSKAKDIFHVENNI